MVREYYFVLYLAGGQLESELVTFDEPISNESGIGIDSTLLQKLEEELAERGVPRRHITIILSKPARPGYQGCHLYSGSFAFRGRANGHFKLIFGADVDPGFHMHEIQNRCVWLFDSKVPREGLRVVLLNYEILPEEDPLSLGGFIPLWLLLHQR